MADHDQHDADQHDSDPAGIADDAGVPRPGDPTADQTGDEVRDALPADLDVAGFVGPYQFPDNSRRRIPAVLYAIIGAIAIAVWATSGDDAVLVNKGVLLAGLLLVVVAVYTWFAGWHLAFDEKEALVRAQQEVGFPVGHASAQMGWRGLRSRPTWKLLLYSAENPPTRRGLVLIDGVDGSLVDLVIEANPEDWSQMKRREPAGQDGEPS